MREPVEETLETPLPSSAPRKPPLPVTLIATALGAGFLPVAPGTWGTLVAIPLAWALGRAGEPAFVAATLLITLIGSWAAGAYCEASGRHDNQQIVIDEVAGYLVTLLAVPRAPAELVAGFALFRIFDVWKPPPVRAIDRRVHGGFGVVADDLAAGVYAGALLALLHYAGALAWLDSLAGRIGIPS